MAHGVKIRGIYTTALTKLLLNAGYAIIDPSPEIQERFSLKPVQESPDIVIQDREDHQGIDIVGESYLLSLLVRLLQETLMDAILLEFAALAETPDEREEDGEEAPQDIAGPGLNFREPRKPIWMPSVRP